MKKNLIVLLSITLISPLIAATETACLEDFETPFEIISCLDKRERDLSLQRDKLFQAQINSLQNRISYLETLIQLQQGQLDALKRSVEVYQLPQSCRDIQEQDATKASGLYPIDLDGPQGEMPLNIYCNMDLQGGGWSLIYATNAKPEEFKPAREVIPHSARYLAGPLVRILAAQATEILIIDADNPSRYIKSVDELPIQRLRALQTLTDPDERPGRSASQHWEGTERDRTAFWGQPNNKGYPTVIYHAANNSYGLHLSLPAVSKFDWNASNHAMSVYIR